MITYNAETEKFFLRVQPPGKKRVVVTPLDRSQVLLLVAEASDALVAAGRAASDSATAA